MKAIDEHNPPSLDDYPCPSVCSFERGLDPWHTDAFPVEFAEVGRKGIRKSGWFALDWCGNAIGWEPDTAEKDHD